MRRLVLQLLLSHGVLNEEELKAGLRSAAAACGCAEDTIAQALDALNSQLEPIGLEVRRVLDEETGEASYGIANLRDDELSRAAAAFRPEELERVRELVEAVIDAEGSLAPEEAVRIARRDTGPIAAADQLLARLQRLGYLQRQAGGRGAYTLGRRAFLELRTYLEERYGLAAHGQQEQEQQPAAPAASALRNCEICHELVLRGLSCSNPRCDVKLHMYCARRWFSGQAGRSREVACPRCQVLQVWSQDLPAAAT